MGILVLLRTDRQTVPFLLRFILILSALMQPSNAAKEDFNRFLPHQTEFIFLYPLYYFQIIFILPIIKQLKLI